MASIAPGSIFVFTLTLYLIPNPNRPSNTILYTPFTQ